MRLTPLQAKRPNAIPAPSLELADHAPNVSYRDIYTAYVSSSPRGVLDGGVCTRSILSIIRQTRALLPDARIVVVFDGRSANVSDIAWQRYLGKKAAVRTLASSMMALDVIEHSTFLHQAVGLRAAMNLTKGTPLVFVTQDDLVLLPRIRVSEITRHLTHDAGVRYVRLFQHERVDPRRQFWSRPARRHPTADALFKTYRFSDRPHFAHRAVYEELWQRVREDDRNVPEILLRRPPRGQGSPHPSQEVYPLIPDLWYWAPSGSVQHEVHDACGRGS